jgi:hypothetical protein
MHFNFLLNILALNLFPQSLALAFSYSSTLIIHNIRQELTDKLTNTNEKDHHDYGCRQRINIQ